MREGGLSIHILSREAFSFIMFSDTLVFIHICIIASVNVFDYLKRARL